MLVGRPGLSPVMIGREAELERLTSLLRPGGGATTAVALVAGEAGVGKTRLVRELLDAAPEGTAVLAGQADPGALGRPFELVLDVLDGALPDGDPRLAIVADRSRSADDRQEQVLALLAEIVETSADPAARRPAIVVFDDLHWADSESLAVLDRLASGPGPMLVVGTYRPDVLDRRHPVADLLPRLERRHAVTHIHLDRLGTSEVAAFLHAVYGQPAPYRVVEALHARTGGNPFFLEELVSASGGADPEELTAQPLPWSLGELVRSQLEDLDSRERCVLEAAAVLGRRVTFDVLAAVSGFGEDELIPILRTLVGRELLFEAESDVFAFRHALAREAIEHDLLGRERRRLHLAALDALRSGDCVDMAAVAHHAHGAGRYDDMVEAARVGADEYLRQGSSYQALQLAELGLSEAGDDLRLLAIAGRAAWLVGLLGDAVAHTDRRLRVARRSGDVEEQSSALRLAVRLAWEQSERHEIDRLAEELISLAQRLPAGEEKARAFAQVAQALMLRERLTEAIEWADQAVELADELDLPEVRVAALAEKGSALVEIPDLSAVGASLLSEVATEAEQLGEWVIAARALNNLVRGELIRTAPADGRTLLDRMRDAARNAGFDSLAGPWYWQGLAELAEWEGDFAEALRCIEEGLRRERGARSWIRVHEAGLALEAGEVERAADIADSLTGDVEAMPTRRPGVPRPAWLAGLDVHIAARRGDLAEARRRMPALLAAAGTVVAPDANLVHDVAAAVLRAGMGVDEVRSLVDLVNGGDAKTASTGGPFMHVFEAQLAEAAGDSEAALERATAALAAGPRALRPSVRGSTATTAARAAIALGRLDEARQYAETAAAILARWTGWRVDELRAVERRLGIGAPLAGPDTLTPREREVVGLLAEGLTNAELAARLFIAPKTAAVHVSNILAKLGMSSRSEVAAFAVREGLTT